MSTLDELRKQRIEKLKKIRELGIDPYPAVSRREQTNAEALKMLSEKVTVVGRLRALRGHGGSSFADLVDQTGRIQLFFSRQEIGEEKYQLLKLLDLGDFIEVSGEVFNTQAGETTVKVKDLRLLTKSIRPLPEKWHGLVDTETRLRKRYLDLIMNPEVRELFIKKANFWQAARKFLKEKDFLEVETPVLEAIPGGADARPFITHHHTLDIDLYLRISLELHLKRLMVGGYDKVFEIGRIFRNEGIDAEHLQDYTQLEFYWGYADYNKLMDFVEEFYKFLVKETMGSLKTMRQGQEIDWSGKWDRVDYSEIFKEKTGLDPLGVSLEELEKKAKELKIKYEENIGKGRLIDLIYKKMVRPSLVKPCFLINLPVEISPLAKRIPEKPELTQRILVMAGGTELGNGFSELNDPIDQKERFIEQQKLREAGDEEAQMYDRDFVEALEYGMPPTAGFGMSERVFSFLVDKPIRETVFFPTMRGNE
ncbi:lysine--tRNA ligase [Candidatus Microgenomates bacterium]|jgi:lysyl-tRNA synthetase class 2|nr:MAG: lysine--tRNA ligase [Candidatus Microgenomates bacterium]